MNQNGSLQSNTVTREIAGKGKGRQDKGCQYTKTQPQKKSDEKFRIADQENTRQLRKGQRL